MHVIVMHNPSAGQEDHSAEALVDEIERRGHQVVASVNRREELDDAVERGCDLVVAAGGDGTVNKVCGALIGTSIPFTIIPLGTANNTARALGCEGTDWWERGRVIGFDVLLAHVDDDHQRFVEAIGFGAFALAIDQPSSDDRVDRLMRDRRLLAARIASSPLEDYEIIADGADLSGEYFLVEALNISMIGPRVALAPEASPHDGMLDLVLATQADRRPLLEALDRLMREQVPTTMGLPVRRARHVRIAGKTHRFHADGDLRKRRTPTVEITVEPGRLRVLVPPQHAA
jgi:diacylglycerol kinase family enzyme